MHRIRLNARWDAVLGGDADAVSITALPCPIDSHGVRLRRRFNGPTGLNASDRLRLLCQGDPPDQSTLNGVAMVWHRLSDDEHAVVITDRIERHNVLELDYVPVRTNDANRKGSVIQRGLHSVELVIDNIDPSSA